MIEFYDFGVLRINGKTYRTDLLIDRDRIIDNWWRKEGHRIFLDDLFKYGIKNNDYDHVLIGTGYYGMVRVDDSVLNFFKNSNLLIDKTQYIVQSFNRIVRENNNVLAMFHLTC